MTPNQRSKARAARRYLINLVSYTSIISHFAKIVNRICQEFFDPDESSRPRRGGLSAQSFEAIPQMLLTDVFLLLCCELLQRLDELSLIL